MSETLQNTEVTINTLLQWMCDNNGSDLHVQTGEIPMVRCRGSLVKLPVEPLTYDDVYRLITEMLTQEQINDFYAAREYDCAYAADDLGRFRVNLFFQQQFPGIVMRIIGTSIMTVDDLGLPPILKTIASNERGLVLVTGATGSGKSTTLAALIDYINSTRNVHIMTIEDPIEFVHQNKQALINQREVGTDTLSFANALKYVLRQDPDVILVGEMRDMETMLIALTAAETGHLVFGTLHTVDATQSIERIINFFPSDKVNQVRLQLSMGLKAIISQRLLPRLGGQGRAAALEILQATPIIQKYLLEGAVTKIPGIIQSSEQEGMQTFNQALVKLYQSKQVSFEDAMAASSKPDEFKMNVQGIYSGTSTI